MAYFHGGAVGLLDADEYVAELLQRHGRHDDAIKWAEKGIAAFPGERLDDLVRFCIAEHLRRGDAERVELLAWQRFQRQPGSEAYFELVGIANQIGRADDLAAKALAYLWQLVRAEEAPGAKRLPSWQPPLRSALVAIHLGEKDAERMWETFCGGPVDVRLWDKVAARRGTTHPDEAVTLYKKLLPHAVNAGTKLHEASGHARLNGCGHVHRLDKDRRSAMPKSAGSSQVADDSSPSNGRFLVKKTWKPASSLAVGGSPFYSLNRPAG